jgi:hypothetical protein
MITADSVLDNDVHKRLIADLPRLADTANVPISMIHHSAKTYVSATTLDWVRQYRQNRQKATSLMIEGMQPIAPETQMFAIAGVLLRNFIDARLLSLNDLIKAANTNSEDEFPSPTVILIPNLFVVTSGKSLTSWQIQTVYDILLKRRIADKLTVVYVQSMDALTDAYGELFAQHLLQNYKRAD